MAADAVSDEEARRARAARLHARIDGARTTEPPPPADEESPRQRIERRMRELDEEELQETATDPRRWNDQRSDPAGAGPIE